MEIKYRTFWPRFWSGWIDTLVFLPFILISNYVYSSGAKLPVVVVAFYHVFYSLLWYAYSIYFHGKFGQTLGKMAMKVKVMDLSETRTIDFKQALLRDSIPLGFTIVLLPHDVIQIMNGTSYMLNPTTTQPDKISMILICVMMVWGILEIVTMLFNSRRRAIHDFIAGSIVVRV